MTNPRTPPGFQERCARWLLLLTFLHTLPAVWITPVAGGTVPAAALLAFGVASLFSVSSAGDIAITLFAATEVLKHLRGGWKQKADGIIAHLKQANISRDGVYVQLVDRTQRPGQCRKCW